MENTDNMINYGQVTPYSAKVGEKKKARTIYVNEHFLFNPEYTITEKILYQSLDMYHNKAIGGAFPKQEELAEQLGVSSRTIRNTLKTMEEKGMVYVIACKWKNSNTSANNFYVLNEPDEQTGKFNKENFKGWQLICPNKKALVYVDKDTKTLKHEWL